jgi:hypothetical protein
VDALSAGHLWGTQPVALNTLPQRGHVPPGRKRSRTMSNDAFFATSPIYSRIAVVCRSTWGETFFEASDGHDTAATSTCRFTIAPTP